MSKADELVREKHHDALNIQRKVSSVEKRWQRFLTNVEEYRGLLEAAVEFYQLYEQVGLAVMKCYSRDIFMSYCGLFRDCLKVPNTLWWPQ